jgi:FkbM family methyltransferase
MSYDAEKFEMRDTNNICGLPSLLWLKSDQGAFGAIFNGVPIDGPILDLAQDTHVWMEKVKNFGTVVQAGGCMGMVPYYYAGKFQKVYTFEPDVDNFFCLDYNCNQENVTKIQKGLGSNAETKVLVKVAPNNAGMHRVANMAQIAPNVPRELLSLVELTTIDALQLDSCDLIHLDIELYELEALIGARETITKFRPVIVVETGGRPSPAHEFLSSVGYDIYKQCRMDAVYLPRE